MQSTVSPQQPEGEPEKPNIVGLLLAEIDTKLSTVERSMGGTLYNEFDGSWHGEPTRFQVRQIPVELNHEFGGATAIIGLKPKSPATPVGENETQYRFIPAEDGNMVIEKLMPGFWQTTYDKAQRNSPDATHEEVYQAAQKLEAETIEAEKQKGLNEVGEEEKRELLEAFKASQEDPVRNALAIKLTKNYEKNKRTINKNVGLPNEPWLMYMGRRVLRRLRR